MPPEPPECAPGQMPGDPVTCLEKCEYKPPTDDFSTVLGRVSGTTYVGRTSAGGLGADLDLDGDGSPDVRFDADVFRTPVRLGFRF